MKKFILTFTLLAFSINADQKEKSENCHNDSHSITHFAPAGVMGAHLHKKGEWMIGMRSMHMEMDGLRDGTKRISTSEGHAGGYMVVPKDMTMQMHMLDLMYGLNDDWTLTLMVPWVRYSMNLHRRMTMGMMTMEENFKVRNEGLGDIKLGSIFRAYEDNQRQILLGLTLNLPTADLEAESNTPVSEDMRLGYPMQIGSGTWDFIPSIVYNRFFDNWSWGTKLSSTIHTGTNSEGYRRGDTLEWNLWGSKALNHVFALNGRIQFKAWEDYHGKDDQLAMMSSMNPVADPHLRSGKNASVFGGFTWQSSKNSKIQFEAGIPFYQEIDGPNLETDVVVNLNYLLTF